MESDFVEKSAGKTLLNAQYVKGGFTSSIMVYEGTCQLVVDDFRCYRCDGRPFSHWRVRGFIDVHDNSNTDP